MPQGHYKSGQIIEITYQASGGVSGLTDVVMEIFDETGSKDIVNFPDVTMTEIGSTARYSGVFTPDNDGKWRIMIDSATRPGQTVKDFDVIGHNMDSVGAEVKASKVKIDGVEAKVIDIETNVGVVDSKIDAIDTKIDGIAGTQAGPMIG